VAATHAIAHVLPALKALLYDGGTQVRDASVYI
jgi:hypothetical protein